MQAVPRDCVGVQAVTDDGHLAAEGDQTYLAGGQGGEQGVKLGLDRGLQALQSGHVGHVVLVHAHPLLAYDAEDLLLQVCKSAGLQVDSALDRHRHAHGAGGIYAEDYGLFLKSAGVLR